LQLKCGNSTARQIGPKLVENFMEMTRPEKESDQATFSFRQLKFKVALNYTGISGAAGGWEQ